MLVTFTKWRTILDGNPTQVSVNPAAVSDVEDWCGESEPGSLITLKNKKTYLVAGKHEDIIYKLNIKLQETE